MTLPEIGDPYPGNPRRRVTFSEARYNPPRLVVSLPDVPGDEAFAERLSRFLKAEGIPAPHADLLSCPPARAPDLHFLIDTRDLEQLFLWLEAEGEAGRVAHA